MIDKPDESEVPIHGARHRDDQADDIRRTGEAPGPMHECEQTGLTGMFRAIRA